VTGIRIIPDLITVRGDPAIIEVMQPIVETTPVSLDGLTSSVVREITLNLPPGVAPVSTEPIQMFISIQALQGSTKVTVPVQVVGLKAGLTATIVPTTLDVILSGPLPVLNLIRIGEDIIVSVDATSLTPGTYQLEPRVQVFRSEVKAESIFPSVISITIKAQPLPN
jgi:YbbR domain-containing protein